MVYFDFCPFCHASFKIEKHIVIGVYIENSNLTNIYLYYFSIYYPYGTKDKKDKSLDVVMLTVCKATD